VNGCDQLGRVARRCMQKILLHVAVSNALMKESESSLKRAMAELSKACRKFTWIIGKTRTRRKAKELVYCTVEHSDSNQESIRIDSLCKKSAF